VYSVTIDTVHSVDVKRLRIRMIYGEFVNQSLNRSRAAARTKGLYLSDCLNVWWIIGCYLSFRSDREEEGKFVSIAGCFMLLWI